MEKLTQVERAALGDLETLAMKCMRSKTILGVLSKLQDRGLIEFDPMGGTAKITDAGKTALSA